MLKITVDQAAPSPSGLVLGCRVEHDKAGWIRFGVAMLVVDNLSSDCRAALVEALNGAHMRVLDTEPEDEPLF